MDKTGNDVLVLKHLKTDVSVLKYFDELLVIVFVHVFNRRTFIMTVLPNQSSQLYTLLTEGLKCETLHYVLMCIFKAKSCILVFMKEVSLLPLLSQAPLSPLRTVVRISVSRVCVRQAALESALCAVCSRLPPSVLHCSCLTGALL